MFFYKNNNFETSFSFTFTNSQKVYFLKKKASKGVFHGPAGDFFSQKKKVVLGNIKHSSDEKNISLNKSESSGSIYSDVESLSGEDEDVSMSRTNGGSLLGSAATTSKTNSLNFHMDDDKVVLPPCLSISLEKKWIDPKIIKTPVEVSIRKLFALDINFSALIRKIFSTVNGFGEATTPSKFEGIIQSMFTSEKSMKIVALLARKKGIDVNSDLKRQRMRSDWAVIIKKIPMNIPKDMIVTTVFEFEEIVSIKIQLIGMWQKTIVEFVEIDQADSLASKWSFLIGKDSVHVAKAVGNCETWASRDRFRALLFTLSVRTTAHDLNNLLERAGGKTCIINRSMEIGNRIHCVVVSFVSNENLESAFYTESIFNEMKLSWARMDLVHCEKCGCFGHSALEYDTPDAIMQPSFKRSYKKNASEKVCFQFAKLYEKKCVSISHLAAFGGKFWTQVVSLSKSSGSIRSESGPDLSFYELLGFGGISSPVSIVFSDLNDHLAVLERFLKLLADQVSEIMKKLSFVELVPLASKSSVLPSVIPVPLIFVVDSDMVIDDTLASSILPPVIVVDTVANLSLSSSKVLTSKVDGLESKLVALEVSVESVLEKLNCLCSGLGLPASTQVDIMHWYVNSGNLVSFVMETKLRSSVKPWIANKFEGMCIFTSDLEKSFLGAGVAVIMNNSLAQHVSKIEEMPGWIVSLSVTVLGLYTGAFSSVHFRQASEMNSIIAKAVNSSTFVVLGENFNECEFGKSMSFRFCSSLGLVNLFTGYLLVNTPTWCNSKRVEKTIDYIFVSESLASSVAKHWVGSVSEFFDMDHNTVVVSIGLERLLDVQLNSLHKQANRDHWKFKIRDANSVKWSYFKDCSFTKILMMKNRFFAAAAANRNLDAMWSLLKKALVDFADEIFSRHWFSVFQCSRNMQSSKFLGLELLIAKIVKKLDSINILGFNRFAKKWVFLNATNALVLENMIHDGRKLEDVLKYLSLIRKEYRKFKLHKSKLAQEAAVREAVKKHMEKFCLDKGSMIKSVLDRPFRKFVLNHLVVNDELILEPDGVKLNVKKIMEDWTREYVVSSVISGLWAHQYAPLDYVRDGIFSSVINVISMDKLLSVVGDLPNGKATSLSGIPNKL
ncbi:hypothetical protein G9A89_009609 [Geosiphon pyriformis]|nr:hypothetical protein G9A89_009609 [Geosiphon pyriformis]